MKLLFFVSSAMLISGHVVTNEHVVNINIEDLLI